MSGECLRHLPVLIHSYTYSSSGKACPILISIPRRPALPPDSPTIQRHISAHYLLPFLKDTVLSRSSTIPRILHVRAGTQSYRALGILMTSVNALATTIYSRRIELLAQPHCHALRTPPVSYVVCRSSSWQFCSRTVFLVCLYVSCSLVLNHYYSIYTLTLYLHVCQGCSRVLYTFSRISYHPPSCPYVLDNIWFFVSSKLQAFCLISWFIPLSQF